MSDARVTAAAEQVPEAFRTGTAPAALRLVLIQRNPNLPSSAWSIRNRFIAALAGHLDARGFRQWQEAGRWVKKGEHAFYILRPRTTKAKEADEARGIQEGDPILLGFSPVAVFGYSQTEGRPLPEAEAEESFIANLPLVEVARSWGISVSLFEAGLTPRLGFYRTDQIGLCTTSLETWAHELVHAADDRLVGLRGGQQLDQEVIAELGAVVLLQCLGYTEEGDAGRAWRYIEAQAQKARVSPLTVCTNLLERTCQAVSLILDTAHDLQVASSAPEAQAPAAGYLAEAASSEAEAFPG